MGVSTEFRSIYRHGFARVAACTTRCTLADPAANAAAILEVAQDCHQRGVALAVFPELGVSGYAISDLLHQSTLLDAVEAAVADLVAASADLLPLLLVGAPLRHAGALYNCALAIHRGRLLGVVPKVHLPNYREFYEPRHFVVGDGMVGGEIAIGGADRAVRHRPAVRGRGRAGPGRARRDLRGHLDPGAAQFAGGAGRRDGARQPVRQQHHDRQGGDAAAAVRLAIGALRRGLSVRRGGRGRVHHRSRLGRPGLDLRERRDAGRDRALSHRPASSPWPISTSTCCATSACRWAASTPTAAAIPPRSAASASGSIRRPAISAWSARSSAFRSCRPIRRGSNRIATRPTTSRSPGLAQRLRATGIKRVVIGVSGGLDSTHALIVCAPRARPARAAARQHPRLHDARLRHLRAHQGQRDPADGGARRHLAGARHPSRRANAC